MKITNFFTDREKELVTVPNHPEDDTFGSREVCLFFRICLCGAKLVTRGLGGLPKRQLGSRFIEIVC